MRPTPSTFNQVNFISPEPQFAYVKETLKAYFDTGIVDDLSFPLWLDQALKRFRKSHLQIEQTLLTIEQYEAVLPSNFNSVREAWVVAGVKQPFPVQSPSSFYYTTDCRIDNPALSSCDNCFDNGANICTTLAGGTEFQVVHKVKGFQQFSFQIAHLLQPGNMNARGWCHQGSPNLQNSLTALPNPHNGIYKNDTFDIRDHKFIVNYPEGHVYLMYYYEPTDENNNQLVPDNFYILDYIRKYLIYKCLETVSYQPTEESFQIIMNRVDRADKAQAEAYILAEIDLKKQTVWQKNNDVVKSFNLNNPYKLRG